MDSGSKPESPDTDSLLDDIKTAIAMAGVSRTQFGYEAAGDPTLILKMERGRRIQKPELRARIEDRLKRIREANHG